MLRSKISMSVSAALLLGMVSITGCGTNNTASDNKVQPNSVRGVHDGRLGVNSVPGKMKANAFDKMEMSKELADRVAAMPEVRSANVMVAGKSAYVAVTIDEAEGGVHAKSYGNPAGMNGYKGTDKGMKAGTRGSRAGTPGMTGMGGSMTGVPGSMTGTGTIGGTGIANPGAYAGNGGNGIMSGSNMTDGRTLKRDIDRSMGTAAGTRTVTPYSTDSRTADNTLINDSITREMKDKIAAEVQKNNKNIDNVYVSANPDFVERANFYAEEFRAGHPLKGFAKEFSTMVERIFPTRSGY